jgi:serine/threonine protein phosphatase 1
MRVLAIGDIHGHYRALQALLERVEPQADDRIVTLGDYVDRGPDSRRVIEWLMSEAETGRLMPLCGNHELMMLRAREDKDQLRDWLGYGGDKTLASYRSDGRQGELEDVPESHWEFLKLHLHDWYETETHFFVHANAYPDLSLPEQPEYMLFWEKFNDPPPHESGKIMVCGHTPQKSGIPQNLGHAVCIDTWIYGPGWLTCLDVATGQYWQANPEGEVRGGRLEAP